jgi:uncharacterized membrane protein YeaQ/YmgE (transglycosylase-associated protein family)
MGVIGWIAIGAVAGFIARALYPGGADFGILLTILLGIAGALLGGFAAWLVGASDPIDEFFDWSTWIASLVGAFVVLAIYAALGGERTSRRVV